MSNRMVEKQRATVRPQRGPQRRSPRDNPYNGVPWGQRGWPDDNANAFDLTAEVFGFYPAPFFSLTDLAGDATYGDGNLEYNEGGDFGSGEFVRLGDNSRAHYATDEWAGGPAD